MNRTCFGRESIIALIVAVGSISVQALEAERFDKAFLNGHLSDYPARGFEWENNRIGISEKVPIPWEPVKVEEGTVTLTHRNLHLGPKSGTALIQQITSLGQPMLADGLALQLTDGTGKVHHFTLDPKPIVATDVAVVYRGVVALPGGKATLECRIEFDGFVHFSLDLEPDAGTEMTVRDLRVTIELHRAAASHYKFFAAYDFTTEQLGGGGQRRSTGLLEKPMKIPFTPILWLGTPQRGIEWMCETDYGWSLNETSDAVHIQPTNDRVTCTQQIINRPVTLTASRHIAFAFYIMPTRPAPFAAWNADSILVNSEPILEFRAGLPPWRTFYGVHRNTSPLPGRARPRAETLSARLRHFGLNVPYATGPEACRYERERAQLRDKGIRYLPYSILHGLPTDLPSDEVRVDRQYLDHWDIRVPKKGHTHYFYICLQHKSAIDFHLYYALKTIRDHKLDGQYFDLSQPRVAGGYARRHTDVDREVFYMPIFGYREFSKRYYAAVMELNPEFLIIQHAVVPTATSSTYALSSGGEHLKQYFGEGGHGKTHFIDEQGITQLAMDKAGYDPDYFKIPDMMFPVGNWFPVFGQCLSFSDIMKGSGDYFREHPEKLIYYCRTFLARSLVHGVPIWIRSLHHDETLKVFQALDRYGPRRETKAVHSALDRKIHLLNDDKTPIEYRIEQKPGRLLLLVSNSATSPQTARFDLTKAIGDIAGWRFVNAETGQVLPCDNGRVQIAITKRDFRIVVGENQNRQP